MPNKLLSLSVKGHHNEWVFHFYGNPEHIPFWREDGLDVVEVCNTIPVWVVNLGLTKVWVVLQDVFNFNFPWRK